MGSIAVTPILIKFRGISNNQFIAVLAILEVLQMGRNVRFAVDKG